MDKMKMRRMAMEKMMAEGPSIASKMKKKDPMMDMEGDEASDEKGFIQMAVSPAEKEMIMAARKGEKSEEDSDNMGDSMGNESADDESSYA